MSLDRAPEFRGEIDHPDVPAFIRSATNSATSFTFTESPSALAASLSMVIQNGQPTASVPAPVSLASWKRAALTRRLPGSSSFQNCAPPAPQQKDLDSLRGISMTVTPAEFKAARGASKILLCLPK